MNLIILLVSLFDTREKMLNWLQGLCVLWLWISMEQGCLCGLHPIYTVGVLGIGIGVSFIFVWGKREY